MEIDKLTEQILEITNNSDYGWIDLDSADADRIRVALTQAMNYIPCCTELKSKECPMCNEEKDCEGHNVCEDCGGRSF